MTQSNTPETAGQPTEWQRSILQELQKPYPVEDIMFRPGPVDKIKKQVMAMPYVRPRKALARVDDLAGPGCYDIEWDPIYCDKTTSKVRVKLTLVGKTYSDAGQSSVKPNDPNPDTDLKSAVTDGIHRCLHQAGIGRYLRLYKPIWVAAKINDKGKAEFADKNEPLKLFREMSPVGQPAGGSRR